MTLVAQRLLADGRTQFLFEFGGGHFIYTVDPKDPTKPNSTPYPLPKKDVEAFLADAEKIGGGS